MVKFNRWVKQNNDKDNKIIVNVRPHKFFCSQAIFSIIGRIFLLKPQTFYRMNWTKTSWRLKWLEICRWFCPHSEYQSLRLSAKLPKLPNRLRFANCHYRVQNTTIVRSISVKYLANANNICSIHEDFSCHLRGPVGREEGWRKRWGG